MHNVGLVLEGGSLRGIFTAGVLDAFMEEGIELPYVVSVSAGTGNAMSYISHQPGRTKQCMLASGQDAFYGGSELIKSRKIMNLDKLFDEFPFSQYPFDFNKYFSSDVINEIVVTNCRTAKPEYMRETNSDKGLCIKGKASCSMPVFCNEVMIDGLAYLDGGLTDPIPVKRAMEMGYRKNIVILTRPDGIYPGLSKSMLMLYHMLYKDYPGITEAYNMRRDVYKGEVELVHKLEEKGSVLAIRPTQMTVGHFETDRNKLIELYDHGYKTGKSLMPKIKEFLNCEQTEII